MANDWIEHCAGEHIFFQRKTPKINIGTKILFFVCFDLFAFRQMRNSKILFKKNNTAPSVCLENPILESSIFHAP